MIIIFSGWPAVYLLGAGKDYINQYNLKPRSYLAADVGGAYSGVCLNALLIHLHTDRVLLAYYEY